ncbi:HhH-GPD superfamily base excision DNA repair protein [Ruminiclostridium cellobioparum subsp. termitidis CT1112]|uniref:DNA-3-methyladenine glycosylase II n=2 Tax=Ruminiclostridium cellobioparum TaxID=29355 RepID=S0FQD1_RUMCE|nr:HhH-GPD superfamily base excision DNA repair protein [Ruminiclostridium cellobioparum subsp. termitidis CT1112]
MNKNMRIFNYGQKEIDYLRKKDKKLCAAIDRIGRIEREVIPDLFTALVNSIVGQQISAKAAETVWNRVTGKLGEITPGTIAEIPADRIQQCGLSHRKVQYIKGIGQAVLDGRIDLELLQRSEDAGVISCLSSLNGIGKWTAEMLLIFSMERPDVVSWGDLAIQRGMMKLYGLKTLTKEQFDRYAKRYSPYGTVASLYLWEISRE